MHNKESAHFHAKRLLVRSCDFVSLLPSYHIFVLGIFNSPTINQYDFAIVLITSRLQIIDYAKVAECWVQVRLGTSILRIYIKTTLLILLCNYYEKAVLFVVVTYWNMGILFSDIFMQKYFVIVVRLLLKRQSCNLVTMYSSCIFRK